MEPIIKLKGVNRKVSFLSDDGKTISAIKDGGFIYNLGNNTDNDGQPSANVESGGNASNSYYTVINATYNYKGYKSHVNQLPQSDNEVGDVWSINSFNQSDTVDSYGNTAVCYLNSCPHYMWDGSEWKDISTIAQDNSLCIKTATGRNSNWGFSSSCLDLPTENNKEGDLVCKSAYGGYTANTGFVPRDAFYIYHDNQWWPLGGTFNTIENEYVHTRSLQVGMNQKRIPDFVSGIHINTVKNGDSTYKRYFNKLGTCGFKAFKTPSNRDGYDWEGNIDNSEDRERLILGQLNLGDTLILHVDVICLKNGVLQYVATQRIVITAETIINNEVEYINNDEYTTAVQNLFYMDYGCICMHADIDKEYQVGISYTAVFGPGYMGSGISDWPNTGPDYGTPPANGEDDTNNGSNSSNNSDPPDDDDDDPDSSAYDSSGYDS